MDRLLIIAISLAFVVAVNGQSGRPVPTTPTTNETPETVISVKDLFEETNGYIRKRALEYEAKKTPFSERLLDQTRLEQRQLAAKNAAIVKERNDLEGDDLYYLGMLHWIAENLDGTIEALTKYIAIADVDAVRKQTARSITVVSLAKRRKTADAETLLGEYIKAGPERLTERARMEGELAKAYQKIRDFVQMSPHAAEYYKRSKEMLSEASSRARGLDEILDAGLLLFESYRDLGEREKADVSLEDMRATAVVVQSPSFYYYAVDQKIKYMIETGRKPAAMEYYLGSLISGRKDFLIKTQQEDVYRRLKRREKQYKLLGEPALELTAIDKWFPGEQITIGSLKGKVVLLDFWATWCGPCFEAFPSLVEWQQEYGERGFVTLGITRYYGKSSGLPAEPVDELEYLKKFRTRYNLNYDFVVGTDQSNQWRYDALALPTAVLIDRKGVIRYIETGTSSSRLEQMHEMVVKLLSEK